MTFLELWDDALDVELASADQTQLFTAVRRKAAINKAQSEFARLTGCTKRYITFNIADGVAEYDLESYIQDYVRLAGAPSIKITTSTDVRYIQGNDAFSRKDPEQLDREVLGWRSIDDGTPNCWYVREESGFTYLGMNPGPDVGSGETWQWIVPYVADPPSMSASTDIPFTLGGNAVRRLELFHQALVHKAAALLEPLRKNYTGVQRQTQLYSGYVAQFFQQGTEDGPDQVTFARNYLGESMRR